ncbi:MEDS domain-containing protein [Rossellomorea vietnamensis]|uniref:MEDS domain-containing protein n=1 Tax=Rossellomorea vietnamensis TaxID=218284 RepID=A0ACD4C588_9BACI|nr:MEDS domain-containing protein [Rossellomorea vietnamensis]UXH43708.1 MEDS domain-containing protein [Rossellomorea vietnamensis]WQI95067.1 MEDS domain-containing protein [Rossellomorea vietnamensis]
MEEKISNLLAGDKCTHVLYAYRDRERYLKNTLNYTLEGVEMGETVILIENERNMNVLLKQLKSQLTSEQLEKIQPISNFEFYQSSGSYHPPAIYEQLMKTITPYLENDISFRSWTNVEWGTLEDPTSIIEWFEIETDRAIHEHNLTIVCAYESSKMPDHLEEALKKSHGHIMSDDDIVISSVYRSTQN